LWWGGVGCSWKEAESRNPWNGRVKGGWIEEDSVLGLLGSFWRKEEQSKTTERMGKMERDSRKNNVS